MGVGCCFSGGWTFCRMCRGSNRKLSGSKFPGLQLHGPARSADLYALRQSSVPRTKLKASRCEWPGPPYRWRKSTKNYSVYFCLVVFFSFTEPPVARRSGKKLYPAKILASTLHPNPVQPVPCGWHVLRRGVVPNMMCS